MQIVFVSSTTTQPIESHFRGDAVVTSGVAELFSWLLDPAAPPAHEDTDAVVVVPDGDSLLPPLGGREPVDELLGLIDRFVRLHPDKLVVVATLLAPHRSAWSYADAGEPHGRLRARATWLAGLADLAHTHANVAILDLCELAESHGRDALVSPTYWYLGRIRFTAKGFEVIADEVKRILRGHRNQAKKVLVLDLDNTLWGGVVGEDGLGGIQLSEDGLGKAYRDFQRHIRDLRRAGTLLAVVSKNDPSLVEEVLERHPMMVLRSDDFVAVRAGWGNKADEIRALADQLNLGLDSFVFLDDNPVERELIRNEVPAVAVPDLPDRPELLAGWFVDVLVPEEFPRLHVLDEDRRKTEQYRARELRQSAQETDLDAFLDNLKIELDFLIDDETIVQRLSQLTQKTNQFNLTTQRLSPGEMADLVTSSSASVVACRYSDRFGDEGIIGLAIVDFDVGAMLNLLMSCRVIGRGVEDALLQTVEHVARERGMRELTATYAPTDRNSVAGSFLERAGYVRNGGPRDGVWTGKKEIA